MYTKRSLTGRQRHPTYITCESTSRDSVTLLRTFTVPQSHLHLFQTHYTAIHNRLAVTWHWWWHGKISLHLAGQDLWIPDTAHNPHVPVHRCPHWSVASHLIGHERDSRSQHLAVKTCSCSRGHFNWTFSVHFLRFATSCWLQITLCSCVSSSHRRILTCNHAHNWQ